MSVDLNSIRIKVQSILNIYDLEGLLKIGAPSDEYENEAWIVAEHLVKCTSENHMCYVVWSVFNDRFCHNDELDIMVPCNIGRELWAMMTAARIR